MAEGSSCPSKFFAPSIVEFLGEEYSEATDIDELFSSVPFELFSETTTTPPTAPPTTSSALLTGPSNARELQRLNRNKNTDNSTRNWARRFEAWQKQRGITISLSESTADELDAVLQNFYAELKKKNGTDYEPESLRTPHMLAALD